MAFVNTERYIEEKQNWLALKTMYISLCACRDVYVGVRERERREREEERERDEFELLTKPFGIPGLHMYLI